MQNSAVTKKAKLIRLVIFDVDGVLTDGKLFFGPQGEEYKVFHVHDGLGLKLLQQAGIDVAIISSRKSAAVQKRLKDLGVTYVYQGQENKNIAFKKLLAKLKLLPQQVAYAGDDLPDLIVMQQVGLSIAVANAHPLLKRNADWQTTIAGGFGAAREISEMILGAQGKLTALYKNYVLS